MMLGKPVIRGTRIPVELILRKETAGVVLIRFPAGVRRALGPAIVDVVHELGDPIAGTFVVVEPGRARISRPSSAGRKSTDK